MVLGSKFYERDGYVVVDSPHIRFVRIVNTKNHNFLWRDGKEHTWSATDNNKRYCQGHWCTSTEAIDFLNHFLDAKYNRVPAHGDVVYCVCLGNEVGTRLIVYIDGEWYALDKEGRVMLRGYSTIFDRYNDKTLTASYIYQRNVFDQ